MTSVATREDCSRCNNSTEINELSVSTEAIYKELEDSIGNVNFINKAIEKTEQTCGMIKNLPSSLKAMVEASSNVASKGIILTGSGGNVGERSGSVEVLSANGTSLCSLPDLPYETWGHTQDGLTTCGGTGYMQWRCYTFDTKTGTWNNSYNLNEKKIYHNQWRVNEGLLLVGGSYGAKSAEFILNGISVATGFELKYILR